jgi:DNA invertase Pin-like site-specific DNA recombinase
MEIGYARVSTDDQDLSLQRDALEKASVERIFSDKMSGAQADRPGLWEAFDHSRTGDTLVVWRLDRLGRSLSDLISLMQQLEERGVGFKSLMEAIDTTTNGGRLIFHIFGALAEFERGLIRERTQAGLVAARMRGRFGGRPPALDKRKIELVRRMHADRANSISDICEAVGVSRATLYRYLAS